MAAVIETLSDIVTFKKYKDRGWQCIGRCVCVCVCEREKERERERLWMYRCVDV